MAYLWAAYKKGALSEMGLDDGMTSEQFDDAFAASIERFTNGWIIVADTKRGRLPAGILFGTMTPFFTIMSGGAWFPWATRRNVVEGTVAFFAAKRREFPIMFPADEPSKRLYEICCMHGVLRRIGTSFTMMPGKSAAVFESRG